MISGNLVMVFLVFSHVLIISHACAGKNVNEIEESVDLSTNSSCREDCCHLQPSRAPTTYYYYQNTGRFYGGSGIYAINTSGYSGQGKGYLNPDYQCVNGVDAGPLPASTYLVAFCKNMMHEITNRPCSYYLMPLKPSELCNRDDFFIHGCQCCTNKDDTAPPAAGCSQGCVVIRYEDRKKIRVGDILIVMHYEPKSEESHQIIQTEQ